MCSVLFVSVLSIYGIQRYYYHSGLDWYNYKFIYIPGTYQAWRPYLDPWMNRWRQMALRKSVKKLIESHGVLLRPDLKVLMVF